MRRQMGMTLMIIGVFCFVVGFVFYSSPKKTSDSIEKVTKSDDKLSPLTSTNENEVAPLTSKTETRNSSSPSNTTNASSSDELDKIISMAIVDGVLTPNERNLINDFANARGLNYNVIIQDLEKRIALSGAVETEIIDISKRKGNDFEKFVVQKFNKKYFRLKEWAGDKYVNGVYAETTQHPDLLLEHSFNSQTYEFAVECKWRKSLYNDGVIIANSEQLKRYREFEKDRQIPVFITIGIGGKASSPDNLYVVPLKIIKSNFVSAALLEKFQKQIDKDFYFYTDSQKLM